MISITITIGCGANSNQCFLEATDDWVWMRIHELRLCRLAAPFHISIQTPRASLMLATPTDANAEHLQGEFNSLEQQIIDIWLRMGMHCPHYTAGSAVFFMQRLRLLLDRELQSLHVERELAEL
jgi:hypothetical protein